MATLPASGYLSNAGRTVAEEKQAFEDQRDFIAQFPGGNALSTLTIATGSVTATRGSHQIDTEAAAATDDLTNILQTNLPDGSTLLIQNVSTARVVVVKSSAGGAGQIVLMDSADVTLKDPEQFLLLRRDGTNWTEIFRTESLNYRTGQTDFFVNVSSPTTGGYMERVRLEMQGSVRLKYISATQIRLDPYNGRKLMVKDNSAWRAWDISTSGITAANTGVYVNGVAGQNLAASTTYEVYVFILGSTPTVDFRTPGHSTESATGVEIKTGVDTRTLVGMVRTNGASQFSANLVRSWFNRAPIGATGIFTASRTTVSTTYVEVNTEIRTEFLCWADDLVMAAICGTVSNDGTGNFVRTSLAFDGTTAEETYSDGQAYGNSTFFPVALTLAKTGLADGYHYATLLGRVSAGTGTWGSVATVGLRTNLQIAVTGP